MHDDSCYEIKQTLICPLEESEEHVHDESCFQQEQVLICDKEESESVEGHEHSPECYLSVDPVCGKEEHTHSKECTSNKELKEKKEDWENSIPETLSDKLDEKIVQIAKSQKDYKEVKENFELDQDGKEHYYTRYGEWYGKPYEDWNIMFASFVLHYAGIKNEQIPYGHDWNEWIEDLSKKELFEPEGYEPQNGDLIFFKDQKDENVPDKEIKSYVGILVDQDKNKAIVGDLNDQVKEIVLQEKEYETMAYVHPEQEVQEVEDEKQPTEQDPVEEGKEEKEELTEEGKEDKNEETKEEIEYRLPEEFKVETEDFTLTLKPRSIPGEQEEQKEENKQPEEESKEQEETEKTTDNELQIKKFSLEPEENIQDKIDEEINRSEDELEQIQEEAKQEQEEEENKPIPTLQIEKIDETTQNEEDQLEIQKLKEQSEKDTDPEQLLDLSFYKLRFFVEDQEINLEDQKFDAELTPTQAYFEKNPPRLDYSGAAEEIEKGVEVNILQETPAELSETLVEEESSNDDSMFYGENSKEILPMAFSLRANKFFAQTKTEPLNAKFTVQYYAYISKYKESENITSKKDPKNKNVPVIDMTKGIPTDFRDLTNDNVKFYDIHGNNLVGGIAIENSENPEILFRDHIYHYHNAPNLFYFDRLANQASYKLNEIWVLKENIEKPTDNKVDWINYLPNEVYFTNKESLKDKTTTDGKKYIFIEDNKTVIRLIYKESSEANLTTKANFYDYDITNDSTNDKDKNYYPTQTEEGINGIAYGINSPSNYSTDSSAPKLAFGNANTGIDSLVDEQQNTTSFKINQRAMKDAQKTQSTKLNNYLVNGEAAFPVFGLVKGTLGSGDKLNYAVNSPNLFNDGNAAGKTTYDNQELTFKRRGNTYTLTSATVANHTKSNLDKLFHPSYDPQNIHNHIWTNNFWPMDGVYNADPHTGYKENNTKSHTHQSGHYPPSDHLYEPHNNMFGMFYQVDFELDEDYMGPLEYFFFGDDDLWVYLDGKLIVDIGGVHSSYGAYVDLREKLPRKTQSSVSGEHEESKKEKHTLTIFYTERGLSGSTCYMEFNLPSVTSVKQPQETGGLRVYKETEDDDKTTDYQFTVTLKGEAGMRDYIYTKTSLDNSSSTGLVEHDPAKFESGAQINLKSGEHFEISYLPNGTQYEIKEINVDGSTKVYTGITNSSYTDATMKGNSAVVESGKDPYQNIAKGNVREVYFKNVRSFTLPETGGIGIEPPIMASGISLIATSGYVVILRKKGWWSKKKK